jgi:hypothetical protein
MKEMLDKLDLKTGTHDLSFLDMYSQQLIKQ